MISPKPRAYGGWTVHASSSDDQPSILTPMCMLVAGTED
eukprot:CAMPEP_0206482232 /NCGR_PEP_ID=MMETSP0324_2-20121206/38761_1 /ASSEMBLY_ACC=CAM_ASM_000836 /TAXON_ID=2866 /ORGANISM="Crypthecodinium cohnii, Strain Seligo" /LENGTH=38 /DNA_ID= /DNA_START= /DNA_END= /DNA_ORIENTATION=